MRPFLSPVSITVLPDNILKGKENIYGKFFIRDDFIKDLKNSFPGGSGDNQPMLHGFSFDKTLLVSAFVIVMQEYIVQILFDVSGNAPSGKSADGEVMAHFLKLFPMFFLQFLAGNQFFQFSFGTKNSYFMKHFAPPRMDGHRFRLVASGAILLQIK